MQKPHIHSRAQKSKSWWQLGKWSLPAFITEARMQIKIPHGVSILAQWVKNPTSIHEDVGSIAASCGIGHRSGSDPTLLWLWLWLWHRLAAIALLWPQAWELPYVSGMILKRKKKCDGYIWQFRRPSFRRKARCFVCLLSTPTVCRSSQATGWTCATAVTTPDP